ncbi:hypothetical protein BP5796_05690 [Coleophoma crateriformis]|uniref:Uncharacterized protein n=1 Tax=Coleophoma crateriformis TaxID=565419 RepID=A0A3D8S3W8_9HELO|nr:hypothetical protein BP5796_05690 [Coleophoma crateriformis]
MTPPVLTTIFTPPPSCSSLTYDGEIIWCGQLSSTAGDHSCYPSDFSRAWYYFYSPRVCPHGWTSAGSVSDAGALVSVSTETNALCCPSGVFIGTGPVADSNGIFCGSVLSGNVTNVLSIQKSGSTGLVTLDAATRPRLTAWADFVQVRWQSTDEPVLASVSSVGNLVGSATSSQASSRAVSSLPSNTNPPPSTAPINRPTNHLL